MRLADYQRAVLRLSLDEGESTELMSFALYRHMIRSRFTSMAQLAFRRSWALLGEPAITASFDRYLAEGPRSPLLRTVIADFADFLLRDAALSPRARDLVRFEAARWRVSSAELDELPVREVDFDGVLVLNATLEKVALMHDVSAGDDETPDPHVLLMYRRPGEDDVRWYRAQRLFSELLTLAEARDTTLGELVQELFAGASASDVEEQLEQLVSALTIAVERGVLRGVRDLSTDPSSLA